MVQTHLSTDRWNNHPLVVDNLAAHATAEMREYAASHGVCLLFTPPNCTDMMQVTDIGLGHALKKRKKNKFVKHFSDPSNTDRCVKGQVAPRERRELNVRWLSEATEEFYAEKEKEQQNVEKIFGQCGRLTPLDESGEQLRKIKGYKEKIVAKWQ